VHIVIMGCGRVGSLLARRLDEGGHSVAVVDQDPKAFRRLGSDFAGVTVSGMGFDRETLETAGIARAHSFAAVSSGDNTNIIAARVARETYSVEQVIARIYDPERAEVYQRLGIPTVATVSWTAGQIMRGLLPLGAEMTLAEVHLADTWNGRMATELEFETGARVAFITRYGKPFLTNIRTVIQQGDLVHLLFDSARRQLVEDACSPQPGSQS
jgi:trk system potassium uptake protein